MPSTDRALLILACAKTKRHDAGQIPAIDRYDGPAFRVLRRALRERPGLEEQMTVYILSAEFGLIPWDRRIPDYDRRMTPARAAELHTSVRGMWTGLLLRDRYAPVHIDLGQTYWQAVRCNWPGASLAHGGIGQRLKQLRAWLWGLEL